MSFYQAIFLVSEFPDIEVFITVIGNPIVGQAIELFCNATTTDDDLLSTITLKWQYNGMQEVPENVSLSGSADGYLALTIDPIDRYHDGNYTCYGILELGGVQTTSQASETYSIAVIGNIN